MNKQESRKINPKITKNIQEYSKLLSILLTAPERQTLADTLSKMNRMDLQFKKLGMRFTLKVGAEKID